MIMAEDTDTIDWVGGVKDESPEPYRSDADFKRSYQLRAKDKRSDKESEENYPFLPIAYIGGNGQYYCETIDGREVPGGVMVRNIITMHGKYHQAVSISTTCTFFPGISLVRGSGYYWRLTSGKVS